MERSGEAQQLREDRELEILLISYLSATIGRRGHKSHELRRPKAQPHPNPNQVQMGLKVRSYHYIDLHLIARNLTLALSGP